jgi:hypothetical protein
VATWSGSEGKLEIHPFFSPGPQHLAGVGQEQCRLPILLILRHVGRTPTPGLSTVPGPMAMMVAVVADIVTGHLAFPTATNSCFSTAGSAIAPAAARLALPTRLLTVVLG